MAVEVVTSELVAPCEPTPRRALWLSNLDLAARNGYTPTVYFFRRPDGRADDGCPLPRSGFFSADVMRTALAAALVPFYPFAGRLGSGRDGRAEIDCNAEGALFVVARSAAALDDFEGGFAPSKAMRDLFVPAYDSAGPGAPLLMLQVTFFRCGGVALGTAMHHFVIDGRSAFNFIRTWAGIARGDAAAAAVAPSVDRTPLRARAVPAVLFDHTHEYGHGGGGGKPSAEYASAILRVTGAQAAALRARAGAASSTFRALAAHVWRCACAARALDHDTESRLYTMVDMRARLSPPLPDAYFGNAVARASASARVGDLLAGGAGAGGGLAFAARRLRAATCQGDAYARSLVDYLETAAAAALPRSGLAATDLRVISWLGMPSYDADFGWGEPALLAPALMYYTGFVYLLSCPGKGGGVAVAAALEPERMARFKELFFEGLAALE